MTNLVEFTEHFFVCLAPYLDTPITQVPEVPEVPKVPKGRGTSCDPTAARVDNVPIGYVRHSLWSVAWKNAHFGVISEEKQLVRLPAAWSKCSAIARAICARPLCIMLL